MNTPEVDGPLDLTVWLDPVCPFSWNTARWVAAVADTTGATVTVRLMSLAVLNEGRDLPAPQRARMTDSRRIGRLMAAVSDEMGPDALRTAYFAFARPYFEDSATVDEALASEVAGAVRAQRVTPAVLGDVSWDEAVRESHQASQDALGGTGGSPLLTLDGHTVFGPVLTAVPDTATAATLLGALRTLIHTPQFSELSRPRAHPT